jgi:hypothetical protein
MGFLREAHKMLTGAAIPRLSHVLKPAPKDPSTNEWMQSVDGAHLSTWLNCLGATNFETVLSPQERDHLSSSLDLPPQFGGVGLQSLVRAVDEELLGSWASITTDLIKFFRSKDLNVYTILAEALESMVDVEEGPKDPLCTPSPNPGHSGTRDCEHTSARIPL